MTSVPPQAGADLSATPASMCPVDDPRVLAVIATPLIRGVFECRKDAVSRADERRVIAPGMVLTVFPWEQICEAGSILERFRVLRDAESVNTRSVCDH